METSSRVNSRKLTCISNETPPDRISALPESILLHILSFLPTKHAVRTGILSTRWRYIWTSIPILDFDYNILPVELRKSAVEQMKFVCYVHKVLLFHNNSHLQKFSLNCVSIDIDYSNIWIEEAIKKNVQDLSLCISEVTDLPQSLFTCNSLVSLRLSSVFSMLILPTSIDLTRLRTLDLHSIVFMNEGSFQKLISSCPVLENMSLDRCMWPDQEVDISSPSIKNLSLSYCPTISTHIKISTHNLMSFKYIDQIVGNYSIENLSSLIDAFIDIHINLKVSSERHKKWYEDLSDLVSGVSTARSITLSDSILECLRYAPDLLILLPTFHNLNKLILTSARNKRHFQVISCLLQSSPILESLVVNIKPMTPYYESEGFVGCHEEGQESKELSLECFLDHLKVVKISWFGGSEDELKFVKLLLENARNMERVIVEVRGMEEISEIRKKLLMLPRASASCIISVS